MPVVLEWIDQFRGAKHALKRTQQLLQAVRLLRTLLSSGYSLLLAMQRVQEQAAPPLKEAFGECLARYKAGQPLDQALVPLQQWRRSDEMDLFVTAIALGHQAGGSLQTVLRQIEGQLTKRMHLHYKLRSLTAQGRLQGWVLALLPITLILIVPRIDPSFLSPLFHTPAGWITLSLSFILNLLGLLWIGCITRSPL